MHPQKLSNFCAWIVFASILLPLPYVLSWKVDMPGGLKLVTSDRILSFTTDLCPGGVFFKQPIYAPVICGHGYFFRRPNGCKMNASDIFGAEEYTCRDYGRQPNQMVQAFIPVTTPNSPLEHTITMYDDEDTLKNFRRFTFVKGLEEQYHGNDMGAKGMTIVNPNSVPAMAIGEMCYQGKSQAENGAFRASLNTPVSSKSFLRGCEKKQMSFPWAKADKFAFTNGYSPESAFQGQIQASLPIMTDEERHYGSDNSKLEIWDGLAYCLQDETREMSPGKVKVGGLHPSLETLESHCVQGDIQANDVMEISARRRTKRYIGPQIPCLLKCLISTLGIVDTDPKQTQGGNDKPPPPPPV